MNTYTKSDRPTVKISDDTIYNLIYSCKKAMQESEIADSVIDTFINEVNTKSNFKDILATCVKYVDIN
jgi:hypothetical protein